MSGIQKTWQKPSCVLLILALLQHAHAALVTGTDEQAGLPFWEWQTDSLSIRFIQRVPDQTRAYFAGRGFDKDDVSLIAGHCIFQTIFKNTAPAGSGTIIEYDLTNWVIEYDDQRSGLKTREDWQAIWTRRETDQAQKIAFEWSLLPTRQRYQPADYNWGMSIFPLPHGSTFNLQLSWQENGTPHTARIENMQCARDIYLPPTGG